MSIGDRVETPNGPGTIAAIENPEGRTMRYGVKLDVVPTWWAFMAEIEVYYYFPHELTKSVKTNSDKS